MKPRNDLTGREITRIVVINPAKVNVYDAEQLLEDESTVLIRLRRSCWHYEPIRVVEGEPISDGVLEKILRVAEPRDDL